MESFYGGRRGISFVIVKQFDGLDIPQPNSNGEYTYTGNYYAVKDGFFLIDGVTNQPISITEENRDRYTWKYHFNDGTPVQLGSNIKFPKQLAQGMKQCFSQGGSTTDEVGYGEYVIIDTIKNCHDYNNLHNLLHQL